MTVRVTTLKGPLAGAYYVEQLPSYYLDAGEPRASGSAKAPSCWGWPGRWTMRRSWP